MKRSIPQGVGVEFNCFRGVGSTCGRGELVNRSHLFFLDQIVMKVSKPTQYDCIFFIVSQSLFQQTTTAEDIQKHYTPTNDGEQHYVVKQVNKVIGGTFGATLVCTDMALCSKIRIWIPGTNCVELNGKSTEEKEKAWEGQSSIIFVARRGQENRGRDLLSSR